nr:maestro heat-like repeat-containing protein family member 2A isoform X1 [Anas platyrhynchos]
MRAGSAVSFWALSMLLGLSPPCGTLFPQLTDDTKEHSQDQKAELSQCILLQARIYPEETILFLESQLGHEREAVRVAALGLLSALARCDEPAMAEKLPQVVEAVKRVCRDPSIQARNAPPMLERLRTVDRRGCLENGQRLHTSTFEILAFQGRSSTPKRGDGRQGPL